MATHDNIPTTSLMEEEINKNKSELWNLSVRDIFYKYVRFLPLILLSVAIALLIAFAYLRWATRYYSATGAMLIKSEQKSSSNSNDKVEDLLSGGNRGQNIQSEIEIMKSRPLMERVVNKLGLQFNYSAKGTIIKSLNVYRQGPFLLRAYVINDSTASFSMEIKFVSENSFTVDNEKQVFSFGQVFKNGNGVFTLIQNNKVFVPSEFKVSWQPASTVAYQLVGGLKILPKTPGTSILSVSFETTNGQMAADIVNTLMVEYDSLTIEQSNISAEQTMNFIDGRLDVLKEELDSIRNIELKLREEANIFNEETQEDKYLTNLSDGQKAIGEQELKINMADMIEQYVSDKENKYTRVVPSALGIEDVTLNEMVTAYNKAQLDRKILLDANIPPANPAVKEAEKLIESQRQNLQESLKNVKFSYVTAIGTLKRQSLGDQGLLEAMPYKKKQLLEILRQLTTKQTLYTLLEQKREEAAIQRAATTSNTKIIDIAGASSVPVKPSKRMIQLMALAFGLALPLLLIFMAEVLNDKISTRYDIERITQAPILGEVGHSFSDDVLIVNKTSRSMVAEQFRIIRSNLQYMLGKKEKGVILITSSFSGEGKSYISTNMGAVLALTGKKTIILEFDIRKPKILSGLNITKKQGISNYLVGKAELPDLIVSVPEHENLFVLPCGPIPPNPSELLLDQKVTDMFEWLRQNFDMVIIDTAPVGMVSDAMTLGNFADCTLYLVRQGHTFKKQVALIDELYKDKKLPKVSIIINDVKVKPGYGYYGYGRYGYGYGYGAKKGTTYYTEETPPPNFLDRLLIGLDIRRWFKRKK